MKKLHFGAGPESNYVLVVVMIVAFWEGRGCGGGGAKMEIMLFLTVIVNRTLKFPWYMSQKVMVLPREVLFS